MFQLLVKRISILKNKQEDICGFSQDLGTDQIEYF
jgi:hypothetical protein